MMTKKLVGIYLNVCDFSGLKKYSDIFTIQLYYFNVIFNWILIQFSVFLGLFFLFHYSLGIQHYMMNTILPDEKQWN